ncbi:NAD(P)-dependent oxidoreductase [Spongiivirga citrea]|uniref:2-hydroxyacid dehydrogenase n=1 Tax=Spongiivirga citrea TaxID=1481457 RepID=A0A6M0CH43_9FLAO|nr:NAD(P)-dependent oxidoreductase [Spongiivirga citrea]NER16822.1 2-hydroxyacid dehydrogenase [Spongiivirga citrea]
MKVLIYSAKPFEIPFLKSASNSSLSLEFTSERLTSETAARAVGFRAVSVFSADDVSAIVLEKLRDFGVKFISLRSAGFDNVNLKIAKHFGFKVANVPKYSPNAIAEHAIALLLGINRHLVLANKQLAENNFTLDGLVGFNLESKTVGILGTGKIGSVITKIAHGFDCNILANDKIINDELVKNFSVEYVSKEAICRQADIIIVSLPLTSQTHYLIDETFLKKVKKNTIIVNIARGAIVKTKAILQALNSDKLGGYATDVYEKESGVFFYDHSSNKIQDEDLAALIHHPKVLLTPHQAFATKEALTNIAEITIHNLIRWNKGNHSENELV